MIIHEVNKIHILIRDSRYIFLQLGVHMVEHSLDKEQDLCI